MVPYRIKTGYGAGDLFTRVGLQLEAYCSGIGKVLLTALPEREREQERGLSAARILARLRSAASEIHAIVARLLAAESPGL